MHMPLTSFSDRSLSFHWAFGVTEPDGYGAPCGNPCFLFPNCLEATLLGWKNQLQT
ncbi:hypothetical protein JOB18_014790 [Solea senegalensis]|uniref:Uncharacterized protein n=1 Tax=Solea senegalensis TaxID=28829 RepID=A0AAV6Q1R8_SOLSE|nr:hypothetical protein JOB18_014790 [Solea senegalensis]